MANGKETKPKPTTSSPKTKIKGQLGDLGSDVGDFFGVLGDLLTKEIEVPDPFGWRSDPVGAFQSGVDDIGNFLGRQADALKVKGSGTQNVERARNYVRPAPAGPSRAGGVVTQPSEMDARIRQDAAQRVLEAQLANMAGKYQPQGIDNVTPVTPPTMPSANRGSPYGGGSGRTLPPTFEDRRTDSVSAAAAQLAAKRAAEQNALFAQGARGAQAARQTSPELNAIADIAGTSAVDPFAAADAAGTDIRGRDLSYLQDPELNLDFLTTWDTAIKETLGDTSGMTAVEAAEAYETASAQKALDDEIINQDVFDALEVQIATDEGGNINAPIFQWGVTETGADQIVMVPKGDPEGVPEGVPEGGDPPPEITVPPEEELTYEQKQKQLSTDTYNDRIKEIQKAVKDGNIDIDDAQTAFNTAKNELFAQMAALNEATYGTVEDEFQARTTQRGTDVADMLALLAGQGVEQNLIQDVIGGDIGMNLAGYGEETDAMRDFMGALELIGQQGSSEAEMLGNYMFDSYRQDLDTTGRNMELQSAMQMLAEQQAAAEQNLQSSMLGPYFGLDPALMMAGMGAGIDVAGVAENRDLQEQAATNAMDLLLAQQGFATTEREAGQTFTGGQNYQNNLWDYVTDQTMNPYQSGMLQVAQDEQQMDTLSSLMQMMQPSEAAAQAQAQADYDNNLAAAIMQMQQGYMPETWSGANSFTPSTMTSPATTALDRMTPEMISALEQSDFDMGNYLVDQAQQEQETFATVSLADAIGMDPMQMIGASQHGILDKLINDYTFEMTGSGFNATASDPQMDFPVPPTDLNPEGSIVPVSLSNYRDMLDFHYPNWDGPADERTFEMMTPSGQSISVGAELEDLGAYVDFLMNAGLPQDQILQYVQGMIPIGNAAGE